MRYMALKKLRGARKEELKAYEASHRGGHFDYLLQTSL